ncbi:hypothetical protein PENTCL1PPCAC_25130, partial [Pristionchus entomophagus]
CLKFDLPHAHGKINGGGPFARSWTTSKHHKSSHRQAKERDRKEKESIASSNKSKQSKQSTVTQVKPIRTNTGSYKGRTRLADMNSTKVVEL